MRNIVFFLVGLLLLSFIAQAQTTVTGSVSGTWTVQGSPYIATGDIALNGDLIIEPGVRVQFQAGGLAFNIQGGQLLALGTATDSIYFEPYQGNLPGLWAGIIADNNSGADTLRYCAVRYAVNGVWSRASANNTRPPVVLEHCNIYNNSEGGLLNQVYGGAATAAVSQLYAYDTQVHHNGSNGFWTHEQVWPGASGNAKAWLIRCLFYANGQHGISQPLTNTHVYVYNCTIADNDLDGINASVDTKVTNCIITGNGGYGINEETAGGYFEPEDVIYNCLWENGLGDYNNLSGTGFGYPVQTNYNGDSCDINFSIYLDPLLGDPPNYDYSLSSGSPCIDAGTDVVGGEFIMDPDGTLPDMGALFLNQNPTGVLADEISPVNFNVSQNYPNPFNAGTIIEVHLKQPQKVSCLIYNALGQVVRHLLDSQTLSGQVRISWSGVSDDGQTLPSGMYFYRVFTADQAVTKKMVLLK